MSALAGNGGGRLGWAVARPGLLLMAFLSLLAGPHAQLGAQGSVRGITLDEAIALALERNPIVQAAQRQVETARVQFELADALGGLRISLGGSVSSTQPLPSIRAVNPVTGATQQITLGEPIQRQLSLQLTQPLFTHPVKEVAEHGAQTSVELAVHQQATTEADLILAVKQAYFGLLQASSLERVTSEAVDRDALHLRVAQARVEAGTTARLDVMQAQVDLAESEHQLIQAKGALEQAQNALNNVLGLAPGTATSVADIREMPVAPSDENRAVEEALAQRPELAQLRASAELARIQEKALNKQHSPQVALSTTGTYQRGSSFQSGFSTNVLLGVTFPISDGGTIDAQRHQALRQAEQLDAQAEVLRRSIDLQVRQALVSLRVARDQLRLAQASLEAATEAFRVASLAYENGVGPRIAVKDAQVGLTAADTHVVQSIYDYRIAFAQFERAAGVRRYEASPGAAETNEADEERGETDGRTTATPPPEGSPGQP